MENNMERSHAVLAEALELRFNYHDMLREHNFSVPRKHTELCTDTAKWCVQKLHTFNKDNPKFGEMVALCNRYLEICNDVKKKRMKSKC